MTLFAKCVLLTILAKYLILTIIEQLIFSICMIRITIEVTEEQKHAMKVLAAVSKLSLKDLIVS